MSVETSGERFWADESAEVALQRYHTLVNAVDDGVYRLDAEGRFEAVNDAIVEMTGRAREELLGEHASLVLDDDDYQRIEQEIATRLSAGRSQVETFELRVWTADSSIVPCELRLNLLVADGEFRGTVGVIRDIREEQRKQELLRKERRYEAIFEDPNILVGLLEPDGTVIDINETAMEYVDANLADVAGKPFWETPWWGGSENLQADIKEWTERAAAGEYVDFEIDLLRPDGEQYTVNGYFRPVTNEEGDVVSIIVSNRDVTERKRRERQLEESERRYRTLVENFPNGVVTLVNEDLTYRTVGGSPTDTTGFTSEEAEGKHVSEVAPPPFAEKLIPCYEEALDGEANSFEIELDDRFFTVRAVPIRDSDGEVFAALGMSQDVTERIEYERRLERYKEYTDDILDSIDDVFYVLDESGELTRWNESLTEVSGYTDAELAEMGVPSFFDSEQQELAVDAIREGFETGSINVELKLSTKDGGSIPFEFIGSRVEDPAGETVLAGIGRDVTERKRRERKLEENEQRYRTIIENFPNGSVGLFDEELRYTAIGGQLLDRLDVNPEDRVGYTIDEIYSADLLERIEPYFRAALRGEESTFEIEFRGRHLYITTLPVTDAEGEIFAGMHVVEDITERKRHERELKRNKEQLETLFEVLPVGVIVAEADGKIVKANDTAQQIWGGDVFDAESIEKYDNYPVEWVESGESIRLTEIPLARVLDGEELTDPDILEIEAVDGERRIIELEKMPIRDETGEIIRGVVTMSDITERRETQRQLAESERLYRTLAEYFPNGVVGVYDHDLRYTLVAGEKEGDPAPSVEEAEGKRMPEIYPDDVVNNLEPLFRAAVEDGETGSTRTSVLGRHWQVWVTPLRDADGEIFAGLSFAQDITEQVERERRLEELVTKLEVSNERLEQFAYAASHDLQEPLRMVSSYLRLLDNRYAEALDEDGEEFLEYAVDGADRMREMIEGLLEYSRVDTRGDPFEPVDLNDVVADVRQNLQVKIEESNAEVTVADLPRVDGDAGQLRQFFQNLVENAIEYSGDDPPQVEITSQRHGDKWLIAVRDEGIGIAEDSVDRIFEVFQSLHSHENHGGTGIGLALCERIVERHGGDIWVESEPGDGSTFYMTLPSSGGDD